MNAIYFDSYTSDEERRMSLYSGDLFVYSSDYAAKRFRDFTAHLISDAFGGLDPELAQWNMPVEEYVNVLKKLKPVFIHHPQSKKFIQQLLSAHGCDLEQTYFDVPRLRSSTSNNYLTSGIAYAFHPHRDTWYSAPMNQIIWWMPVYSITPNNGLAFHPQYWSRPIKNDSNKFNYQEWINSSRKNCANQVNDDTRWQPKPLEPIEMDPQLRLVMNPGGMVLFSAAQLHSSVPNTSGRTRFSIDFRTINIKDVMEGRGALNIDTAAQDLTLQDFIRASDFEPLSETLISQITGETASINLSMKAQQV